MSTIYTWVFDNFETKPSVNGLMDVVSIIHWRLNAERDGQQATCYGTVGLDDPDPKSFVAFDDITKQWAIAKVISDRLVDVDKLKQHMETELDNKLNPPTVNKTPPFNIN